MTSLLGKSLQLVPRISEEIEDSLWLETCWYSSFNGHSWENKKIKQSQIALLSDSAVTPDSCFHLSSYQEVEKEKVERLHNNFNCLFVSLG